LKSTWGIGALVAVLLSVAAGLLGLVGIKGTFTIMLLLVGLWTLVAAFTFAGRDDRSFYAGWGVVLAGLSITYLVPLRDALGLILLAIVVLIVATAYFGRGARGKAQAPAHEQRGDPAAASLI
jgi:hypothetical protein